MLIPGSEEFQRCISSYPDTQCRSLTGTRDVQILTRQTSCRESRKASKIRKKSQAHTALMPWHAWDKRTRMYTYTRLRAMRIARIAIERGRQGRPHALTRVSHLRVKREIRMRYLSGRWERWEETFVKAAFQGYSLITSVSIRRFPALGDDIFIDATQSSRCWLRLEPFFVPAALVLACTTFPRLHVLSYSSSSSSFSSFASHLRVDQLCLTIRAPVRAPWDISPWECVPTREPSWPYSSALVATRTPLSPTIM